MSTEVGAGVVIVGVGAFDGALCLRREGKSTMGFVIFERWELVGGVRILERAGCGYCD